MKTTLRILYLEDEPNDVELVRSMLETEGFSCDVVQVETRTDFLEAVEQGGFDIILADYLLPAFDGMTALAIVREKTPDVPFIFVSGTLGEELAIESLKSGATDYVLKQRISRIVPTVRRTLHEAEERAEHKWVEEALRASEEKFRQFFENEPEYCYMVSPEGVILDVNSAALKALGYRKEEIAGKPLKMIYAPESLPKMKQLFAKWQKTGHLRDEEMVVITKKGDRHIILLSAAVVRDKDGKIRYSVSVQRDITDRKRALF